MLVKSLIDFKTLSLASYLSAKEYKMSDNVNQVCFAFCVFV